MLFPGAGCLSGRVGSSLFTYRYVNLDHTKKVAQKCLKQSLYRGSNIHYPNYNSHLLEYISLPRPDSPASFFFYFLIQEYLEAFVSNEYVQFSIAPNPNLVDLNMFSWGVVFFLDAVR